MEHEAGRELDAQIAVLLGDCLITRGKWRGYWDYGNGRHYSDEDGGPLHYSTKIADAWLVVDEMHAGIDPAKTGAYNYLTLVCTGTYSGWAASFDFNLSHDWYESDVIVSCPFAARADTAPLAVCRAALAARTEENDDGDTR